MAKTTGSYLLEDWTYHRPAPRSFGEALPSSIYQNGVISQNSTDYTGTRSVRPGNVYETWDGKVFKYVEASGALTEGDLVVTEDTVAVTSAANSASDGLLITGTAGATIYENQFRGGYVYVSAGTGIGLCRRIAANSAAASSATVSIYLEPGRELASGAVAAATLRLWHPYRVKQLPAGAGAADVTKPIFGVSYGTVTTPASSGWYAGGTSYGGWVQVEGFCESVKITGNWVAHTATAPMYLMPAGGTAGSAVLVTAHAQLTTGNYFAVVPTALDVALTAPTKIGAKLIGCYG